VKYPKPEALVSAQAVAAIETHVKWIGLPETPTDPVKTSPAYEADE
jgi:hypothetical protein